MTVLSFFTGQPLAPAAPVEQPRKQPRPKPAPRQRGSQSREHQKAMLAKVHIAKDRLSLSEDDYRNMLWDVFGVESSKDLDRQGLHDLLQHLQRLGFEPVKRRDRANPLGGADGQIRKIEALLAEKGRVEGTDVPWGYAVAILKRHTGGQVTKFDEASPEQLRGVIAALIRDARRHGRYTG